MPLLRGLYFGAAPHFEHEHAKRPRKHGAAFPLMLSRLRPC